MGKQEFLNRREVAELLGTSESRVKRLDMPSYKIGGLVKYRRLEIEEWLQQAEQ